MTMSFGVHEASPGERATDVIRYTDKALYAAKAEGRDIVRAWSAGPPRPANAA